MPVGGVENLEHSPSVSRGRGEDKGQCQADIANPVASGTGVRTKPSSSVALVAGGGLL
jgi:hypothetical protein